MLREWSQRKRMCVRVYLPEPFAGYMQREQRAAHGKEKKHMTVAVLKQKGGEIVCWAVACHVLVGEATHLDYIQQTRTNFNRKMDEGSRKQGIARQRRESE